MRSTVTLALFFAVATCYDVKPTQLHLSLAGAADVRAGWFTLNETSSLCAWGLSPAALTANASGTAVNYLPSAGWHHVAKLSPLTPSTTYYYSCGDANLINASVVTSFLTAPPVHVPSAFRVPIFGVCTFKSALLSTAASPSRIPLTYLQM